MNIISEFFSLFDNTQPVISERVKNFDASLNTDGNNLPPKHDIEGVLLKFPERDEVKITLKNEADDVVIFSNKNSNIVGYDIDDFYAESNDDNISIKLEIEKSIYDNTISVYNFDEFSKYIVNKSLLKAMGIFNNILEEKEFLVFELFDSNILFSTNTMIFKNYKNEDIEMTFDRKTKLDTCNHISSFLNINDYKLIPEDFQIVSSIPNNVFEKLFNNLKTIMSMIYICNTSIINKNILTLEIVGQRKCEFRYDINDDIVANEELYKIYSWICTDGNAVDKAIIARNIISLHCQYTDIIKTDERTFSSIQSNFRLYQKNNVDKYLELKNKLVEYIMNTVNSASDIVVDLADRLKQNMLACFTFLFSVILANIVSDQPLDNIFTREITVIFEVILGASGIFIIISVIEMNYKLEKIQYGYNELKNSYDGILDEKDINFIFNDDKVFNENINDAKKKRKLLLIMWIGLILSCLIVIELVSSSPVLIKFLKVG